MKFLIWLFTCKKITKEEKKIYKNIVRNVYRCKGYQDILNCEDWLEKRKPLNSNIKIRIARKILLMKSLIRNKVWQNALD